MVLIKKETANIFANTRETLMPMLCVCENLNSHALVDLPNHLSPKVNRCTNNSPLNYPSTTNTYHVSSVRRAPD